jgi:hypothetical protein
MIEYLSNAWSNFLEWKDEVLEQQSEYLNRSWNYYTEERAVIRGFPIAVISSMAAAYFFQCARPTTGAIFGAVNYLTLTSLSEILRAHHEIDKTERYIILGVSGAISFAFMQTVCKTAMTYQAALILTIAAFGGQLARCCFSTQDD